MTFDEDAWRAARRREARAMQASYADSAVIGRRLRELRTAARLTVEELSEKSGVHVCTIRTLEGYATTAGMPLSTAEALAAALGADAGELHGDGGRDRSSPWRERLWTLVATSKHRAFDVEFNKTHEPTASALRAGPDDPDKFWPPGGCAAMDWLPGGPYWEDPPPWARADPAEPPEREPVTLTRPRNYGGRP